MKKILYGLLINLGVVLSAMGQGGTVTGVVTDLQTGESLPGVNIIIEGTSNGTTTDFDGNYTLQVPSDTVVIIYSFVGMEPHIEQVNGRSVINVALSESSDMLDEIMVVAYGTAKKEAFTGAAEVIKKETLEARPVSSFEKALQGTTAGLQVTSSSGQPGAGSQVRIRGIGSISSSSAPLYVIDGVPMSGALNDINPNDIESMTVLKDAASSSLYGSRAANGVIVITTKKGKKGNTKISFNAQTGFSSRISDGYPLMNSTDFYEQSWMGLYNQSLLDNQTIDSARAYAHENVEKIVGFNPFGVDQPLDENGKLIPGTVVETDTDWRDLVYKPGLVQNYSMNVAGGNDETSVYFSLGYFKDDGTTLNSDFTRYSAKMNVSHKVNEFITAGMINHLSYSLTNAPPGGTQGANPVRAAEQINAASPVYNPDGTYNWENVAVFDFNPIGLAEMDIYEYRTKRALLNAFLDFTILPELTFRTTGAIDYSGNQGLTYYNPEHGNGAGVNGRSTHTRGENIAWNITNLLSWNKQFDLSNVELLLGHEAHGEEFASLSAEATDFAVPGKPHLVWGAQPETPSSYTTEWNMVSFFGQAKYDFNAKYYLSGSLRYDGSSRFGENNKYGLFYSVGGSWRVTEETWMPDVSALNNLKLRASYGTSGNNNLGNFASLGLYGSGANYGGFPGLAVSQQENESLTWETITSLNIGIDFTSFDRLNGTFEYYNRQSDGLLYAKPLSSAKGFTSITTNLGAMANSGFEATLSYDLVRGNKWNYTLGMNISTNNNEILNLEQDEIKSGNKILEPGGDMYQFYLDEWAGVNPENGEPMWFTNQASDDNKENDGEPDSAFEDPFGSGRMVTSKYEDSERVRMGSALPDVYGGFNNYLSYGDFELSFYFYFSIGGKIYNSNYAASMHDGSTPGSNLAQDALRAWTPNNRNTDVPRYVTNNQSFSDQPSSRFLEDGSFLRLKNISLTYNVPQQWCERVALRSAKVFVSGENIWTLSSYHGFDPEAALSGNTNNSIPGVKVYNIGLKLDL